MEGDGRLAIAMGSSECISNLPLFRKSDSPKISSKKYRVKFMERDEFRSVA